MHLLILRAIHPINHELSVIASGKIHAVGRIMKRGNPGKKLPQALTIYNAYLFFIWIATLHDSASGMNPSARNDGKPNVYSIYKLQNKNYGVV
jgi:hypothetical protein